MRKRLEVIFQNYCLKDLGTGTQKVIAGRKMILGGNDMFVRPFQVKCLKYRLK